LKVGVFCPTLNVYGGGEFVAATIANTLAQNNYDVTLLVNEYINQREIETFFGKKLNPSVKVIVSPTKVQPRGVLDFYRTVFLSYIFKSKCDLWIDVYSCRIFPWTNISYIHFPFLNYRYYRPKFPYIKSIHLLSICALPHVLIEKNAFNVDGKLIIANSRYTAEEIRKFSGKKVEVLYPPVSSIHFNNNPGNLLQGRRKNLVVTVSRFERSKGLEKIPHIAKLTKPNVQFAIVGRIHYKSTLLKLQKITKKLGLTERVKFFPNAPRQKIKKILKNAKIYLHTMVGEHFGISIVEAMATGCTPIVHDSGGPKEFVPQEFRYNTIHEAATKITKEIYEWTTKKAEKFIKIAENFREENFAEKFIKLFEQYAETLHK